MSDRNNLMVKRFTLGHGSRGFSTQSAAPLTIGQEDGEHPEGKNMVQVIRLIVDRRQRE